MTGLAAELSGSAAATFSKTQSGFSAIGLTSRNGGFASGEA